MASVRFSHITIKYHLPANKRKKTPERDVYALRDVSVTIEDGQFVVLVGPSGCGKSTFLRTLAGLDEQSSGQVYVGGKNVDELAPNDRGVALVFQEYALYPHMNAFDNMALPLKNAKMDKADIKDFVYGVARRLDIEYLLNRRPKHMSWGQRQRVSLGRAICRRPGVMLLDEPLSGADEELRVELRDTIKALHEEYGFTCVYVTHDMKDALVLADRILTMKSGKIVEDQTRDEFVKKQEEKEEKQNLYLGGSVRFDASGKMIFDGGGEEE